MASVPKRPAPWRLGDLLRTYVATAVGAMLLLAAWFGASGTAEVATQVVWLNVGIVGVAIAGVASAVWLLAGRRAVAERGRALFGRPEPVAPVSTTEAASVRDREELVASAPMTKYHRPGCLLVIGKDVRRASRAVHERAGRSPCGVCRP